MSRRPATTPLREFSRSLPMALLRARESVMARFRPLLREHGVSEQQWRVLRALVSDGPMRASDLSADTLISMPSLSRLLKTLEAKRLIERSVHKEDQRAAQITMTRQGRRLVEVIGPLSEAIYAQIAAEVSQSHLEQLYGLLEEMSSRLGGAVPEE